MTTLTDTQRDRGWQRVSKQVPGFEHPVGCYALRLGIAPEELPDLGVTFITEGYFDDRDSAMAMGDLILELLQRGGCEMDLVVMRRLDDQEEASNG